MSGFSRALAGVAEALATCCFAGFCLMVLAQVGYRYLGISIVFSEELARLLNLYAVFIGIVAALHVTGDIRIDLIDRLLPPRSRGAALLELFYALFMLLFLLAFAWGAWQLVIGNWGLKLASLPMLHQGHIYLAPLLGGLLMLPLVAERLIVALQRLAR